MAVSIHLKQFDGPLDLLLHLIGKAKIDLREIFVSEITEQYIDAVRSASDFDMDEASEFISMAALLVEIKSRNLLPKPPREDEEDPEQALIERLIAYRQFKESAQSMTEFELAARQVFGKLPEEYPVPPPTLDAERFVGGPFARAQPRAQGASRGGFPPEGHPARQLYRGRMYGGY